MPYILCRHIKTSGLQCQSPALTGSVHCFYHTRLIANHAPYRHTEATRGYLVPGQHIQLAPIEDAQSVQVALSLVINALATGQLDPQRANSLLYGLSLASINTRLLGYTSPSDQVRTAEQTPDGLDLAQPGLTSDPDLDEEEEMEEDEEMEEEDEEMEQDVLDPTNPDPPYNPTHADPPPIPLTPTPDPSLLSRLDPSDPGSALRTPAPAPNVHEPPPPPLLESPSCPNLQSSSSSPSPEPPQDQPPSPSIDAPASTIVSATASPNPFQKADPLP